jgi:hypothetical protein
MDEKPKRTSQFQYVKYVLQSESMYFMGLPEEIIYKMLPLVHTVPSSSSKLIMFLQNVIILVQVC